MIAYGKWRPSYSHEPNPPLFEPEATPCVAVAVAVGRGRTLKCPEPSSFSSIGEITNCYLTSARDFLFSLKDLIRACPCAKHEVGDRLSL